MVKTKNDSVHLPLVVTGYILFTLLVVATLLSTTIPLGIILFNPRALHFNVAVTAIALTIGSILPALLGYIIGEHFVKSKRKLGHHFNGILFGLLAYWLMIILSVFVIFPNVPLKEQNVQLILVNLLPSIGVVVVTTVLAIIHARSHQAKQDIIEFKPFSAALISCLIALPVWSLVNNIVTNRVGVDSFVSLAIVAVLGLISYASLHKTSLSNYRKVTWSAVSVSVAFVAVYVSNQFLYSASGYLQTYPTMESQAFVSGISFALAVVGWVIYWSKQVKTLR